MSTDSTKSKSKSKKKWLGTAGVGVVGIVLGAAIGAAGASGSAASGSPEPAPTVTVTAEPETVTETVEVADPLCREVAAELFSMLETMNGEVVIPLANGAAEAIDAFINFDVGAAEQATDKVTGATAVMENMVGDIEAVSPDYITCQNG